jgi:ribonuclease HI
MQWNAEGLNSKQPGYTKKTELENILHEKQISVCCIQETHLKPDQTFKIRGYQCFRSDRQDRRKGGILTLVKNNIHVQEKETSMDGAEYQLLQLKVDKTEIDLLNFYCPNDKPLNLNSIQVPDTNFIAVGDFNSHSQSWGYNHMDRRGEEVETWQDDHFLILVNRPTDTPTFYSRRWHTTSTPDLAFATSDLSGLLSREVGDQLGGSDHRPVFLNIQSVTLGTGPTITRWNYKKANWGLFRHRVNALLSDLKVQNRDINEVVKEFNISILQAAKESIPKGCRCNYTPYWSSTLQKCQESMNSARKNAESQPSIESHNKWKKAVAEFQKTKLEEKRKSWRNKTAALTLEKDGKKLWKLVKSLNEESSSPRQTITLDDGDKILRGKQAADLFARIYSSESNLTINKDLQREIRKEIRVPNRQTDTPALMREPLTLGELQKAVSKLKAKKSPGPDEISNEMLINMSTVSKTKLLEIFNLSWTKGIVPQIWREAITIPILKKGKCKTKAESYRPISLTSCVGKTMERIINCRLKWYLESEQILIPEQAGFRECYSIEDQVTYLSQEVEDAFQEKKKVLTLWVDFKQAFDKVWKDGLIAKLRRSGIQDKMLKWVQSYLHNRRTRVALDGLQSKKVLLYQGVPQGGVISPTLFLVYINDLVKDLPVGVKASLYADDVVLWCADEHATTANYRMQRAADMLIKWAEKWHVTINTEKTSTTLFSLSPKDKATKLYLGATLIKEESNPTYLGVTFDKRLTWNKHIENIEGKARRRLGLLRKLAGTNWGANERTLKKTYNGVIRPHLEFGSTAWSSAANTHLQTLDRVQNQALRLITGAMKTTPITAMQEATGIQTLSCRRDTKTMIQVEKYSSMPDHPMKVRLGDLALGRLKRGSFTHRGKRLKRQHQADLPTRTTPLKPTLYPVPWEQASDSLQINTSVCGLISGNEYNELEKRAATLCMIQDMYPNQAWIHAYTDGSATKAVMNGGAGIFISYPDGHQETRHIPTGKFCSNYTAEVQALEQAAKMIYNTNSDCQQVVIFTDALSVLQALKGGKLPHLRNELSKVAIIKQTMLQWVPSHCGVPGNEKADKLAKKGGECEQVDNEIPYSEMKRAIQAIRREQNQPNDEYHILDRHGQIIIFRLRTGHNRLNKHMYKLRLSDTPMCTCGLSEQTSEHVLQDCPLYTHLRKTYWPNDSTLNSKLYGAGEELQTTVEYIMRTRLTV